MQMNVTEDTLSEPTAYHRYLAANGGMCNIGNHLGVMVGLDPCCCPMGWTFVMLSEATPEKVRDAIAAAKAGWQPELKRVVSAPIRKRKPTANELRD